VADLAHFQSRKAEALKDLKAGEPKTLAVIADLWMRMKKSTHTSSSTARARSRIRDDTRSVAPGGRQGAESALK
jgi:hypothetical protein